jgi:16S rRNA (cytidine1402-2'-O)-methyltransferase
MGALYVVGTPIGNLEDLTPRAARVLGQVSLIAAEDTRVTRRLLNHLGIRARLVSYNEHNRWERLPALLEALAAGDVALVADAGMPGVSDPGAELVANAAAAGYLVESVPGVSAVTTALAMSGLPGDDFLFLGFLPRRKRERLAKLEPLSQWPQTLVILEAPHRLLATLQDLRTALGDREIAVCRELTKMHEEVFRGAISQALGHFPAPRGEFVLVVRAEPGPTPSAGPAPADLEEAARRLARLRRAGTRAKEAVAQVAGSLGLPKNTVYRLWVLAGKRDGQ